MIVSNITDEYNTNTKNILYELKKRDLFESLYGLDLDSDSFELNRQWKRIDKGGNIMDDKTIAPNTDRHEIELKELGLFGIKELSKKERAEKFREFDKNFEGDLLDEAIWLYLNIIKPVCSDYKFVDTLINEFLVYCGSIIPEERYVHALLFNERITGFQVVLQVVDDEEDEHWVCGPWKYIECEEEI